MTPRRGPLAWCALAALLLAGALAAASFGTTDGLAWRPETAWRQPWRCWTAAWVHFSGLHLAANAAGTVLVALLGLAARLPARCAAAWALAWPLTQLGLLARPDLALYGGLSGVLHAGVAVVAVQLLWRRGGRERAVGAALLLGLVLKLVLERPWGPARAWPAGWDIAVAPWAHASGVAAGLCVALMLELSLSARSRTGAHSAP